jgi:hypothetical protein
VTTHERELTEPVDLCTADGRRLSHAAMGWSRHPLHRANLAGGWGRTKRWDYWAVVTDDLAVAITYADIDYLGLVAVWWADLRDGRTGGRTSVVPLARGVELPELPGTAPLRYRGRGLEVEVLDPPGATTLRAAWREPDGRRGRLEVEVARPADHESVNVVIPWSERRFQYTSKAQALPARGELVVGADRHLLGVDAPAFAVLDVGRGRWPYRTRWNWGAGAGRTVDGATVGLQLGGRWTEGTGATENGIVVDGTVVKIGQELDWVYDWDRPLEPWHVRSPDGCVDVVLTPRHDRHDRTDALLLRTEVHQVFGTWSGTVPTPDGGTATIDRVAGFAEESRSRW